MATTGADIDKLLDLRIDKTYSGFYNPTKRNRLLKTALVNRIEQNYLELDSQKKYDELAALIRTNRIFSVHKNRISIRNFIAVATVTFSPAPDSTITVTTQFPHHLQTGDSISVVGISGISTTPGGALTGNFAITKLNDIAFFFPITNSVISGTHIPNTGLAFFGGSTTAFIGDYFHLLSLKAKYAEPKKFTIKNVTSVPFGVLGNKHIVVIDGVNNLRAGEQIEITGIIGLTGLNTISYIKRINKNKFELYIDKELESPTQSDGTYGGGGIVQRVFYEYAKPNFPDRKIGIYGAATVDRPKYEVAESYLKIYPDDITCKEVTIDYISNFITIIDVNNSVIDLELVYPYKFLLSVVEEAARMIGEQIGKGDLVQTAIAEQTINE